MPAKDKSGLLKWFADALPFGVHIVDLEGTVLYWNLSAERVTGHLAQDVLGRKCCDDLLAHCGPAGEVVCGTDECPLEVVRQHGLAREARFLLKHKEGHSVPVVIHALPIRDDEGRIAATAQIFQEQGNSRELHFWMTEGAARIDQELGLPSIAATREELESCLQEKNTAVLLIEVEHADDMSKHFGREMVHTVMRTLARTVSYLIVAPHFLGCWTQGRLLLMVPNCSEEAVTDLVAKVEAASAVCGVRWWGDRITSHIRAKGTVTREHESPDKLIERLEHECTVNQSPAGE